MSNIPGCEPGESDASPGYLTIFKMTRKQRQVKEKERKEHPFGKGFRRKGRSSKIDRNKNIHERRWDW